jgi:hypothetical protein
MPKRGWSPPTLHSVEVRKLASFFISEGIACESRNTPIRVTSPTINGPGTDGRAAEESVAEAAGASTVPGQRRLAV